MITGYVAKKGCQHCDKVLRGGYTTLGDVTNLMKLRFCNMACLKVWINEFMGNKE